MVSVITNRVKGLDGWRGIAILLVLIDHVQLQWSRGHLHPWLQTGQHGVTLFFVLSGFLITTNLLKSSDLKTFYIRRFFRLMPVAWSYLLFLLILGAAFPRGAMRPIELASCVFFFRNYLPWESVIPTGHFWSLSIEEQFYLVWPTALILLGKRRAIWAVGVAAVIFASIRSLNMSYYEQGLLGLRTEVHADALCVGCLLALALGHAGIRAKAGRLVHLIYLPAVAAFVVCLFTIRGLPPLFEACIMAILIAGPVLQPERLYSKVVSIRPLAFAGIVSYSLYVWQQFFLMPTSFRTNLTLDIFLPMVTLMSYVLIEKPMIALGHRAGASVRLDSSVLPDELAADNSTVCTRDSEGVAP